MTFRSQKTNLPLLQCSLLVLDVIYWRILGNVFLLRHAFQTLDTTTYMQWLAITISFPYGDCVSINVGQVPASKEYCKISSVVNLKICLSIVLK